MRIRDWRSPMQGLDLGPAYGKAPGSRGGVLATAGIPPKVPAGLGHTKGQWEKHKERERAKRAQQRWKEGAA